MSEKDMLAMFETTPEGGARAGKEEFKEVSQVPQYHIAQGNWLLQVPLLGCSWVATDVHNKQMMEEDGL